MQSSPADFVPRADEASRQPPLPVKRSAWLARCQRKPCGSAQAMLVALFAGPTLSCESFSRKLTSRSPSFSTLQCPRLKASNSLASASVRKVKPYSVVLRGLLPFAGDAEDLLDMRVVDPEGGADDVPSGTRGQVRFPRRNRHAYLQMLACFERVTLQEIIGRFDDESTI